MRKTALFLATAILVAWATAAAADAQVVGHNLAKEPKYTRAPRYFLLLFGPEGKTRVWCVFDGDKVLYVDRNGNDDLTEADERFPLGKEENHFLVGDITERDGKTTHRNLRVSPPRSGGKGRPESFTIDVEVKGQYKMYGSIEVQAAMAQPKSAPSRHFGGPLSVGLLDRDNVKLVRGKRLGMLDIVIGTFSPPRPDAGGYPEVVVDHGKGVPNDVHPVAEITFPERTPGARPMVVKMLLYSRC